MISNATITSLIAPGAPDKSGKIVYAPPKPPDLTVRAALCEPTHGQRIAMGAMLKDVTAVLYVLKSALAGTRPAPGYEVRVKIDGGDDRSGAQVLIAEIVRDYEKAGGLAHYQIFCREGRK